ncbi:protein kinase domain-containing protein [Pseudodesulfovibrio tunisiensis]|uniref:protein kinase domain-containing protein n=1 Tax=Pseudodesulfovibrio tunisiensis TaxID=463192 RepID=UPI001FB3F952|nr:DUF1566 domain-containing protein [Pseudodesulfovibrio tunisiensis]
MKIGRYAIKGLLGRGGMGVVYKAAMPVTGRMVALKVCRPAEIMADIMGMDAIRDLFLREAVTMSRIEHPNVAGILDVHDGSDDIEPHFTMEYFCGNLGVLMGETYEVEQESRRLGVEFSVHAARQMLAGLDRLHYEDIVHRDVKPFNVMLAGDESGMGQVKLIDFGLSKLRGERMTRHKGMVVGSPYYTAPEQETDPEAADARSDLYSVGVALYRMLTGRLPEPREADRPSICTRHPDLGCEWDDFFTSALAPEPERRFPDAMTMIRELDRMASLWAKHRDATCSGLDQLDEPAARPATAPRSTPIKAPLGSARQTFGLDALWRPKQYPRHAFTDNGDGTVTDAISGLIWEKHGSRHPLSWERAEAHCERLNRQKYANRSDWRLPTVDELATLFTGRTEPGEFCMESVFDPAKARLWSCDTKAFTAAWYADAELGFVWWQDRTCRFHARAVCGNA